MEQTFGKDRGPFDIQIVDDLLNGHDPVASTSQDPLRSPERIPVAKEPLVAGTQGPDYHGPRPGFGLRPSCALCRKRHYRCDGSIDGCVACQRHKQVCLYEPMYPMGRPRKRPGVAPMPVYKRSEPDKSRRRYKNGLKKTENVSHNVIDGTPDGHGFSDAITPPPEPKSQGKFKTTFSLPLTSNLKKQLAGDWLAITQNNRLVPLPRHPSVKAIFAAYIMHIHDEATPSEEGRPDHVAQNIMNGLLQFFSFLLGNSLLYAQEKAQYSVYLARCRHTGQNLADIYGAEHLLRLFVDLPGHVVNEDLDRDTLTEVHGVITDFLFWLDLKSSFLIRPSEYQAADDVHAMLLTNH